jgi:hypothetical protein
MAAQIDLKYTKARPSKVISRLVSYIFFEGRPVTTRGQWINPFVFLFLRFMKLISRESSLDRPLFILGAGRSGTTVLGVTLSMHRDCGFLNEPKAIWHMIHPNEDVGGSYSNTDVCYRLGESDATAEMIKTARKIYSGYLSIIFSKRLVDKYPELSFRVPYVKALFPNAKFIFLARNGWDTCASIENWSGSHSEIKSTKVSDWWGVNRQKWNLLLDQVISKDPFFDAAFEDIKLFRRQTDMAAVEWIATMREGQQLIQRYRDSVYWVKYEDLTNHPKDTLDKLCKFCELSRDDIFMKFGEETLCPVTPYAPYDLHASIQPLFIETLNLVGYK